MPRTKGSLVFELSMPSRSSWNGKWSGDEKKFLLVRPIRNEKDAELSGKYFGHAFGDGWVAGVDITTVDAAGARAARKKSAGFCGYDWMVDSILRCGEIRTGR